MEQLEDVFLNRPKDVATQIRSVFERLPFQLAELWVFPPNEDFFSCRFCMVKNPEGQIVHWGLGHTDKKLNQISRARDSSWALLSGNAGNVVDHIANVADPNQLGFSVYADWLASLDNNFTHLNNAYQETFLCDRTRNIYRLKDLWVVKLSGSEGNTAAILRLFNHIRNDDGTTISQQAVVSQILQILFRLSFEHLTLSSSANQIEELGKVRLKPDCVVTLRSANTVMKEAYSLIRKVVDSDTIVLLQGDHGSGKEVLAQYLHQASAKRANRPYVAFSCANLSEGLIEAELFGSKKGSFTDSIEDRPGKFNAATEGTLLIDEVHCLPPKLQDKLLRVLQERVYCPVGSTLNLPVTARIIVATNRNLAKEVREKRFREDLWYRIKDYPIRIPSLQSRKEDIPLLLEDLLLLPDMPASLSQEVISELTQRTWQGNIREMAYMLRRLRLVAADYNSVTLNDLDVADRMDDIDGSPLDGFDWQKLLRWIEKLPKPEAISSLDLIESIVVRNAFALNDYNKSLTSKFLGVSPNTLRKFLEIYDRNLQVNNDIGSEK